MKSIYRRHLAGGMNSPIYYQPSLLLQHQDTYFEDFICSEQAEGSSYMLRTVGLRHCEPDYRLERKVSSRYAVYYVFSGIGYADGIRVGRGDVVFFDRQQLHEFFSSQSDPCVYAWVTFKGQQCEWLLKSIGLFNQNQVYRVDEPNVQRIYGIFYDMLYVDHEDSCFSEETYLEASFFRILAFSRRVENQDAGRNKYSLHAKYIKEALAYIREHYSLAGFRVAQVADAVGINDAYLRALFKQEIGVSIKEYVIRIRMDKALELLKHSNYNINEIARMIGYPDYRLFVDVFKKRTGLSPSQYRKASDQKKK